MTGDIPAPHPNTLRERLVANSFYNTMGAGISILIGVVTVPVVIGAVGDSRFALLVLAGMLISYASLLDFGLETSLTRFAAFYYASRDFARLNTLLISSIGVNLVLFAIVASIYFHCRGFFFALVSVPVLEQGAGHSVMVAALAAYLLRLTFGVTLNVLNGMQRMDIPVRVGIVTALLNLAGVVFLLKWGMGVVAVAWCQFATTLIYYVVCFYLVLRFFPEFRISIRPRLSLEVLRTAYRYGLSLQVSRVCEVFAQQVSRLTASLLSDLAYVTHYALAGNIAKSARDLVVNVLVPLVPAASELQAGSRTGSLAALYYRASKFEALAAFPLFFSIMVSSRFLLYAWVGPGHEPAAHLTILLSCAYLINILTAPGGFIAQGMGRPDLTVRPALLDLLFNAAFSLGLTYYFGFSGGALGLLIAHACGCLYFFRLFHRTLKTSAVDFCRRAYLPPLVVSGMLALLGWGLNAILPGTETLGRLGSLAIAMGEGLGFSLLFYALLYLAGYIRKEDLADVRLLRLRA